MGAYLDTPVTAKQSSHSVCRVGEREVVYASTAMQGWRVSMEVSVYASHYSAHCISEGVGLDV